MSVKLTKAQRAMLEMVRTYPVDRREVLSRSQWEMAGRMEAAGLVSRSTFVVHITPAGRAALDQGVGEP